jgi:hypothetical protein
VKKALAATIARNVKTTLDIIAICFKGVLNTMYAIIGRVQMVTKEELAAMNGIGYLYHIHLKDSGGAPRLIRLNGKLKTWKTRPEQFRQPVKEGLYNGFYITEDNAEYWVK